MIDESITVTAAPTDTDEAIFLATGGPANRGSLTYIGGGLSIGHNHGRFGTSDGTGSKTHTFGLGLDGEQQLVDNRTFHFTQEGHLENIGVSGGGKDIRLHQSYNPNNDIPSIPLLIMSDPNDLIGEGAITTRMATPGSTNEGSVYYSTGTITWATEDLVGFSNTVIGGMSGSGIFVQIDTDGDGQTEDYTVGVVTHYGFGTSLAGSTYSDLAETLEAISFNPDDLPRYTLMSGFDQYSASHEVSGTFLNEDIIGGSWHDTLFGGGGDDIFTGGAGGDTFVFSSDDGHDVITEFYASEDSIDVSKVLIHDFEFSQIGADVLVTYDGGDDSILFQNAALTEIREEFPQYVIVDGDQDLNNLNDLIDKNYLNDPEGHRVSNGSDVLIGGLGNDTLKGGGGDDTYVYNLGDGSDKIDDEYGFNTLDLSSFDRADVSFRTDGYHDLLIDFANGATVEVNYQFRYGEARSNRISEIVFADGTLNEAAIYDKALADQSHNATVLGTYGWNDTLEGAASDQTLKGGRGDDTYVYNLGDGSDKIDDEYGFNRLDLSSFDMADVSFRTDGYHDLLIDFANGATVEVNYQFRYGEARSNRISEIVFADGTLNEAAIYDKALADQSHNATVLGTYGWNDTLEGAASDQTLKGGYGDDTYVYNLGDGSDKIDDEYGFNTLDLSSFDRADVSFRTDGYHDLLIDFANGATVEVNYQFRYGEARSNRISEIVFADGTLNEAAIYDKALADQSHNATVLGTYGWNDTLEGDASDQTLKGGQGDDTYVYNLGDGSDKIDDSSGFNRLDLSSFDMADVSFRTDGYHDLLIDFANGATVEVNYQFRYGEARSNRISEIVFADGTLNEAAIYDKALADQSHNATVLGTYGWNDTLEGAASDQTLKGGRGDDTYVYNLGDGSDKIDDGYGFNRLDLSSFDMADVSFRTDGYHDLLIDFANGATVEVNYQFRYGEARSNRISEIVFADGTLNEAAIYDKALADQSHNATVLGTYGWNDTLEGAASDQTLKGGRGDDTYVYNLGDGSDKIDDGYGFNTLDLSSFDRADVSFRTNGSSNLLIDFADDATVEVHDQFRYGEAQSNRISEIVFADGTLNEAAIHDKALADQSHNATVLGTRWNDTLEGAASDQTLKGGRGDDTYVYNLGDGSDKIDDGYGFNTLDLSSFDRADVSFRTNGSSNLLIDFADDATVEVHDQFRYGEAQSNRISEIVFADGTLNEAAIYDKALADQVSVFVQTEWGDIATFLEHGIVDEFQFGNKWNGLTDSDGEVSVGFTSDGTGAELTLTAYDVDYNDEIVVLINGVHHSHLSAGTNKGLSDHTIQFAGDQLLYGNNIVTFENKSADWIWGVDDLAIA